MTREERMLKIIRNQGQKGGGKGVQLAQMKTDKLCEVGNLTLQESDYKKAAGLKLQAGDEVLVTRLSSSLYAIITKVV